MAKTVGFLPFLVACVLIVIYTMYCFIIFYLPAFMQFKAVSLTIVMESRRGKHFLMLCLKLEKSNWRVNQIRETAP